VTAAAEQAAIQRQTAAVTFVLLIGLAVDVEFGTTIDVIIDKHAFLGSHL
jgi:hypothetical protein